MYGFNSIGEAKSVYLSNYEEGWQGLGNITPVSKEEFRSWLQSSTKKTKPFAEYASVKPLQTETGSEKKTIESPITAISRIVNLANTVKDTVQRAVIGGISPRHLTDYKAKGIDVDESYRHSIENSAVLHNQKEHGDAMKESSRGQIAISEDDYLKIPEILEFYDDVNKAKEANRIGNEVIIYTKGYPDGTVYYLEEIRTGRKSLAFKTMYKTKKRNNSGGLMQTASPSTSNTSPDNFVPLSTDKGNEISEQSNTSQANLNDRLIELLQETDGNLELVDVIDEQEAEKLVSLWGKFTHLNAVDILEQGDENAVHWFLEDKNDIRSSNYLEDAATEIQVQGLELDYTCVLWDADMRCYGDSLFREWKYFNFNDITVNLKSAIPFCLFESPCLEVGVQTGLDAANPFVSSATFSCEFAEAGD